MAVTKITAKQEAFCRAIALRSLSQVAAYSEVYDTSKLNAKRIADAAAALMAREEIVRRIAVIAEGAKTSAKAADEVTLGECIQDAQQAYDTAIGLGQAAAAVSAASLKAKLAGHLVERKEVRSGSLDEEDVAKLRSMRKQAEEELARLQAAHALVGGVENPTPMRRVIGA